MSKRVGMLILLLSGISLGQKHGPSVDQCRADLQMWRQEDDNAKPFDTNTSSELLRMGKEMAQCEAVDSANAKFYMNMDDEFASAEIMRLTHFLARHNLVSQFMAEDQAGAR